MTLIEQAVLKTLAYADIFDYPLTAKEIHLYLIFTPEVGATFTSGVVVKVANALVKEKQIESNQMYYFLPQRHQLVTTRQHRLAYSNAKLDQAKNIATKLAGLPGIVGIFVTGALAMKNADETDDIDLLIITRPHRLWITRFLVTCALELKGVRRRPGPFHPRGESSSHPGGGYSNQICANMWLDETALSLPKPKRNLYTAHEVVQTLPLINKDHVYERFLHANRWVLDYLPNTNKLSLKDLNHPSSIIPHPSIFEKMAYHLQYAYMKRKMSRETVSLHAAFFHPRNTTNYVMTQYRSRCSALNLKP